jgi:hypothetical protein
MPVLYTYQRQTVKPVFQSDSTVSVMELIAAAHASVPHDEKFLPPPVGQVLCGMRIGTGH